MSNPNAAKRPPASDPGDSLDRLRVFARRIFAVSKKELDQKLAVHNRRKQKAKKKSRSA